MFVLGCTYTQHMLFESWFGPDRIRHYIIVRDNDFSYSHYCLHLRVVLVIAAFPFCVLKLGRSLSEALQNLGLLFL